MTPKQRAYVEAYCGVARGNATQAARVAGYSSPEGSAADNMRNPKILQAIADRSAELAKRPGVLTAEEIQEAWAEIARDAVEVKHRLAALRDAARSKGMFLDRVEHSGAVDVPVRVVLPDNGRGRD
jgi:phage terminase small subunit